MKKVQFLLCCSLALALLPSLPAQVITKPTPVKKAAPPAGIDRDSDIVHLSDYLKDPVILHVNAPAAVFTDKKGANKLGVLQGDQNVVLEAMTDKAYKVRGKGESNGIAGWVGPKNFSSTDPNFVANLKKFYDRQVEVTALIAQQKVAVGMTPDEVAQSLGKATKTESKQTATGTSGKWDYITYEDVPQYALVRDPASGQLFRQVVGVTHEEKARTTVEFQAGLVAALEESEQKHNAAGRTVLPPVVFAW